MELDVMAVSAQLGFGLQCRRAERNELAWKIRKAVENDLRERFPGQGERFWTNGEINRSILNVFTGLISRCAELERIVSGETAARP